MTFFGIFGMPFPIAGVICFVGGVESRALVPTCFFFLREAVPFGRMVGLGTVSLFQVVGIKVDRGVFIAGFDLDDLGLQVCAMPGFRVHSTFLGLRLGGQPSCRTIRYGVLSSCGNVDSGYGIWQV